MKIRLAVILITVFLISRSGHAVEPPTVYLYDFDGNVSMTHQNISQPAKQDMACKEGAFLRTDINGTADITVNGALAVRIYESSELEFIKNNKSDTQMRLNKGSAMVNMRPLPAGYNFEFKTPAGDAVLHETYISRFYAKVYAQDKKRGQSALFVIKQGKMLVRIKVSGTIVTMFEEKAMELRDDIPIPTQRPATEAEMLLLKKVGSIVIDTG